MQKFYLLFFFLTIFSCTREKNTNEKIIETAKELAQSGDLIVRLEDDFTSYLIAGLSPTDPTYGHCGLIKKEGEKIYVYNILPEGEEDGKMETSVRKTELDTFLDIQKTLKFAVYRYNIKEEQKTKMIVNVEQMRADKVAYDVRFSYVSDSAIYCSELISKALENATKQQKKIEQSYIEKTKIMGVKTFFKFMNDTVDLSKYPVVTIDKLYLNDFTSLVYKNQFDIKLRNRANLKNK